ncbi:hypothetical protein [Ruegeria hyattellae]|uniref:hypothetical protein n=1 Tax=Ruegeria hyattellae TaxID=3233337 RepID=UPI00355C4035
MTNQSRTSRVSSNPSDPVFPDAVTLMALWDALQGLEPQMRPLRVALPWMEKDARSLGAVQAAALRGYAEHFGDRIRCQDQCPDCAAQLGLDLSAIELLQAQGTAPATTGKLCWEGWTISYRLLGPGDLLEVSSDADTGRAQILDACIEDIEGPGEELPGDLVDMLGLQMEREDPLAAAEMALECPDCGARWLSGFDACATFLARIEAWARRTLWEVHQLAMRYGWSQRELLQMSPLRREAYLLMDEL